MKSVPSANSKPTAKAKPRRIKKEGVAQSPKHAPESPFQGLNPENAALLLPLLATIESELKLRGLDPSEIRLNQALGVEFPMTVNHTISVVISVFPGENREHLYFSIHADLGRASKVPERGFLLEALLGMNLGTRDSFRLGLTRNDCIRLLYSARVADQMSIQSVGALLDQMVNRATALRDQLSGRPVFFELGEEAPKISPEFLQ
ncbi:MAG: hypothetical protein KGP28_12760 [Bdellovibrionales bacterium]|nr:hypothetical protein [Bdellovibrionales bacterium]